MADYGTRKPLHAGTRRRPVPRLGESDREAKHFYNAHTWLKLRRAHIAAEPLCRSCKARGFLVPARHVDHVIPMSRRPDLALDPSNLQSLCVKCHAAKSIAETRRKGAIR